MNTAVASYLAYLVISIGLTVWVGRTLYKNGSIFLVDVFKGNAEVAKAVNHLLVVGFYLINFGYVSLSLRMSDPPTNAQSAIEGLSLKIGGVLIVLGILHLLNVFIFNVMRNHANEERKPRPPVQPTYHWQPQGPQTQMPPA